MKKINDLHLSNEQIIEKLKSLKNCSKDEDSMFFNYLRQYAGGVLAVDIDGILCEESSQNYENRKALSQKIDCSKFKWIVLYTSRLECDRPITEKWLQNNKIDYHALLMNKLPYDLFIDDKTTNKI